MFLRIVTGERGSGKTRWVETYAENAGGAGFLSRKVFDEEREIGYDLELVPAGESHPLARSADFVGEDTRRLRRLSGGGDWFRFRRFHFNRSAFDWAREEAARLLGSDTAPIYLDEIGPLEKEGKGLYPTLHLLLASGVDLTLTSRPALVSWIRELALPVEPTVVRLSGEKE